MKIRRDIMDNKCAAIVPMETPALDRAIIDIDGEVSRYEASMERLIGLLEVPRPANTGNEKESKTKPDTLEFALHHLNDRLVKCTDALNRTIDRIQEQVGELKLLP